MKGRISQTNLMTFLFVTVVELICLDARKISISRYEICIVKQETVVINASSAWWIRNWLKRSWQQVLLNGNDHLEGDYKWNSTGTGLLLVLNQKVNTKVWVQHCQCGGGLEYFTNNRQVRRLKQQKQNETLQYKMQGHALGNICCRPLINWCLLRIAAEEEKD